MKTPAARTLVIAVAAILVVAAAVHWLGGRTPEMRSPLRVSNAYALADGGSMWVELTDARGARVAISLQGSLHQQPERFPVSLQRWPPLPLGVTVTPGSPDGRALLELVERAGRDGGAGTARNLMSIRLALTPVRED